MTGRARLILGLLILAIAVSWPALAGAAAPQESSKPKIVVPVQPSSSKAVPVQKKKQSRPFDALDMQAFSVALLLGETQGASTPENLPAGATKALADVREFLPYKSYRLLDTQWIRCCAGPNVTGSLRGLDEQQFTFRIAIHSVSAPKLSANFNLLNDGGSFKSGNVTHDAFGQPVTAKPIVSSNFSMDVGETVVIGTSSLKGDKALVVLLTAVPRSTTTATTKKGSAR